MRSTPLLCALLLVSFGCGDDDLNFTPDGATADAGADAPMDTASDADGREMFCNPPEIRWLRPVESMAVGVTRELQLDFARDFCEPLVVDLTASVAGVVNMPDTVRFAARESRARFLVEGIAVGETVLTASYVDRIDGERREVMVTVRVVDATIPACSGSGSGTLGYDGEVRVADGTLTGSGVYLPPGAETANQYHVEPFALAVDCAPAQVPEGYRALGPAVRFGPQGKRLNREIPLTIPVELGLIPEGRNRGSVQVSYTGPGVTEPRIVPVASPNFAVDGLVSFEVSRLGTYQAVVLAADRGTREREFSFRGIMGVSMGSSGSALIGTHNTERFDFIGPLGGPVDWIQMLDYIRHYHIGGFCNEDQRAATPEDCNQASTSRTPTPPLLHMIDEDFEHWHYDDDYMGQGGVFDREQYVQIFRDLGIMFGNLNTTRTNDPGEPNVLPPGVPESERSRSNADRCASPVVLAPEPVGGDADPATGFFDEEYNSAGQYPVITFCDRAELVVDGRRDIGVWDPNGNNNYPVEVGLAVDINGNSRRDAGEPIIRQMRENFSDCGLDQVCSPDEEGYDPDTNPDPAGDDYDYQYNPLGTEGNWLRDYTGPAVAGCDSPDADVAPGLGELFDDTGMDAVAGTPQLTEGGYDTGEGDDCWTISQGMRHMLDNNPRGFVAQQPLEVLRDVDFFSDGGVRDLFSFAANQNQLAGAFVGRGLPLGLYNSHAGLLYSGLTADNEFQYTRVDWREVGQYVHLRYGNIDADEGTKEIGDGGHVGTILQVLNRLLSTMAWMSARWPDGDRTQVTDQLCPTLEAGCMDINQLTFDFTASDGRTGPTSVVLPPGYFQPENADLTYPVVYLLHGYGMSPDDLLGTGIIIWNLMTSRRIPEAERLQKMIFVFPDGSCGGNECIKGTFYANAPAANGAAQMETFTLELMDYIDATFRVKAPATFTVPE